MNINENIPKKVTNLIKHYSIESLNVYVYTSLVVYTYIGLDDQGL